MDRIDTYDLHPTSVLDPWLPYDFRQNRLNSDRYIRKLLAPAVEWGTSETFWGVP